MLNFKSRIAVITVLSILAFSCSDEENIINGPVKANYEYKLQNQIVDSISIYTINGKINDPSIAIEAAQKAEQDFSSLNFPQEISYTEDTKSIKFLDNSTIEVASKNDMLKEWDYSLTADMITAYADTLVSYGYDKNHKDYYETQFINQILKHKPLILSQNEVLVGYNSILETKLIRGKYFYGFDDILVEPRVFYIHIASFEGQQFALQHGEFNNEVSEDAFKLLNSGDSLLVYHLSRIYQ